MLNPRYWYTDENGKVQKYLYCRLCLAGPFKITEKEKFFNHGPDGKEIYCKACSTANNHFNNFVTEGFFTHKKSARPV